MNKLESLRDHQERARKLASYWKKEIIRIKKEAPRVWIWVDVEEVIAMIEQKEAHGDMQPQKQRTS